MINVYTEKSMDNINWAWITSERTTEWIMKKYTIKSLQEVHYHLNTQRAPFSWICWLVCGAAAAVVPI